MDARPGRPAPPEGIDIGVSTPHSVTVRLDPDSHDDRAPWVRVLEQAFSQLREQNPELYGSGDGGGTIANTWHAANAMSGIPQVCVVVEGREPGGTESVPTVVNLPLEDARDHLCRFFDIGGRSATAFVHDGRSGHVISLSGHENGRFVYYDPWPGDSLLCGHQNVAGVDAQEHGEHNWSVTEHELGLVLVALLAWPALWAEAGGEPGARRYAHLPDSDFWSFFGIHESSGTDGSSDTVALSTGGFQDENAIELERDAHDRITRATLRLKESWCLGPPWGLNPFALDLGRSFIRALTPQADQTAVERVLWPLSPPDALDLLRSTAHQEDPSWKLLAAYAGGIPELQLQFGLSALRVKRTVEESGEDTTWIELEITTH